MHFGSSNFSKFLACSASNHIDPLSVVDECTQQHQTMEPHSLDSMEPCSMKYSTKRPKGCASLSTLQCRPLWHHEGWRSSRSMVHFAQSVLSYREVYCWEVIPHWPCPNRGQEIVVLLWWYLTAEVYCFYNLFIWSCTKYEEISKK